MQERRKPNLIFAVLRVLLISAMISLVAFALTLFVAIAVLMITSAVRGGHVDLTVAYRSYAFPTAKVALIAALVLTTGREVRAHRQRQRGQTL